jgi:hypothetical protein
VGGKILKVLFGSIEYFEKEMLRIAKRRNFMNLAHDQVMEIYSEIKDEFINDFICDEDIRKECLNNLSLAIERFLYICQTLL